MSATPRAIDPARLAAALSGPCVRAPNLATNYLVDHSESVADWDGLCGELASVVCGPDDDIIYVEGDIGGWAFHMVPLIAGLIHDAWCEGEALPAKAWLKKMFGSAWVEVSFNGDTFYEGPADKFHFTPLSPASAR